jgi:HPt (histidine-containing phosphotransfer) domain-containing protein
MTMTDMPAEVDELTKVRVLNPPNFLKQKIKMAPGLLDDLLARADQMVANLQGEFEAGTEIRIKHLLEAQRRWLLPATREEAIKQLRRLCHDIKGEAGTFGYPLLSDIADLFGDYLREVPGEFQRREAVKGYIDTFQVVWAQKIKGEGGAIGRELLASLMKVNAKAQQI